MKRIDLTGQRFGRLTVIRLDRSRAETRWICRCDCGTKKTVRADHLRTGAITSCRCVQREITARRSLTHGCTQHRQRTPEYRSWDAMKARCYNPKNNRYGYYHGHGITVCPQWLRSFEAFLQDMGPKPSRAHSIDRIDNDGPYCPDNCRWATRKQQAQNRRPLAHGGTSLRA